MTLMFEARRCIHARFCVTGAPSVFLANVQGPWIHPDTMDVERLAAIAQECPSGAIRYRRKDGRPDESAPPVNLAAIREAGPYAVRGRLRLDGVDAGFRATLCRCGASKNKPYCDGSHHEIGFSASGEPASGATDMLPVRDGDARDRPAAGRPFAGARKSRDHERYRAGRCSCDRGATVPLRRERDEAVLRRDSRPYRLPGLAIVVTLTGGAVRCLISRRCRPR